MPTIQDIIATRVERIEALERDVAALEAEAEAKRSEIRDSRLKLEGLREALAAQQDVTVVADNQITTHEVKAPAWKVRKRQISPEWQSVLRYIGKMGPVMPKDISQFLHHEPGNKLAGAQLAYYGKQGYLARKDEGYVLTAKGKEAAEP